MALPSMLCVLLAVLAAGRAVASRPLPLPAPAHGSGLSAASGGLGGGLTGGAMTAAGVAPGSHGAQGHGHQGACGGPVPARPNARGVRLALKPDAAVAYGARHITVALIDLDHPSYRGSEAAAAAAIRAACPFGAWHPSAADTRLTAWTVDDWHSRHSNRTFVLAITSGSLLDKWAACLAANVPGVYGVVGPACPNPVSGKSTDWHVTLYGLYSPADQKRAVAEADGIVGGAHGGLHPYLVQNPANEGSPKGSRSAAFVWTHV